MRIRRSVIAGAIAIISAMALGTPEEAQANVSACTPGVFCSNQICSYACGFGCSRSCGVGCSTYGGEAYPFWVDCVPFY